MSERHKPITFEDLNLSTEDMEKIAAGARVFLAPEETDVDVDDTPPEDDETEFDIDDAPPEAPSDLVTRRNLRE